MANNKEEKRDKDKRLKWLYACIALIFWLAVWELVSICVNSRWLLPSPVEAVLALGRLGVTAVFWKSIGMSALRILLGFVLAVLTGVVFAAMSYIWVPFKIVVNPFFKVIKAVPVASFVILVLLWVRAARLPVVISFTMVVPLIYINVLQGLEQTDKKLLEMAYVYRMSTIRKIKYIFIPSVKPFFLSACTAGLGFCWKSGVAAEVIALVPDSIGRNVYDSKLYLLTDELFAWTIVIVLVSVIFEKAVTAIVRRLS